MEIEGNTIKFKSNPLYYHKEATGLKNNTVRIMSNMDEFITLLNNLANIKKIQIYNTESSIFFERELTDISVTNIIELKTEDFVNYIFVFTWKRD